MTKSTKTLIGIVVVLGAIFVIQRLTSSNSTTTTLKPFAKIDTSQINSIAIDFSKNIVMSRASGGWEVTWPVKSPASMSQISMFLVRIATNPTATVVANDLKDSVAYGLVSSSPMVMLKENNGKSLSFRLGNITPDFNGCYMQVKGDKRVLELSTNFRTMAGQSLTDWRDKEIFTVHLSNIAAADFSVGDTLYHFFKSDTLWKVNNVAVPKETAQNIIESLLDTRATGFVDTATHVTNHLMEYGITLNNKEHFAGTLFQLSGRVCLTNTATNQTYVVSSMLPQTLDQSLRNLHKIYLTRVR